MNEIIKRDDADLLMMTQIAHNDQTLDDIKNLTSSKVTDQLKVFLISQARNELKRVVKLTKFLDRLENDYISKVEKKMENSDLTLKQYSDTIYLVTDLLSRSNDIITKVLRDDSLTTILNTTIYHTNDTTQVSSVVSSLKDAQSREKVRNVIQNILISTSNYDNDIKEVVDNE